MSVKSGEVKLAATLTLPDRHGPVPACLLLSGSGPLDRDSNMAGQRLDIARSLATALADAGVATLRYDKRGVGESTGDYLSASFDDETSDAIAALDTLRALDDTTGRVAVIGHSVGATLAIRLARHPRPPDAYVLLAGAAQRGEHGMAWQAQRIAEPQPLPLRWFRSRATRRQSAVRERLMASTTPTLEIGGQTAPAAWFRGYMTYDPSADLRTIDRPVLAITGGKDVQVDPADVATIGELVVGPFESDTPDRLTHLLRSDDKPAGLRRYGAQMQRPPDPTVIDRVAVWTAAHVA